MKIKLPINNDRKTGYNFVDKIPGGHHLGEDLNSGKTGDADFGIPVVAPFDAEILYVDKPGKNWGVVVAYNDDEDRWWRLGHLKDFVVKKGDMVVCGQVVGHCGKTGAKSPHVHYEVWKKPLASYIDYPKHWSLSKIFDTFEAPFDFTARIVEEEKKNSIIKKPMDPIQTKFIPGIMWQSGPNCYSYSLKHLMQYKFLNEKGIDLDLDADRFDKEAVIWNKGRLITLYTTFLDFAKEVGIWDKKSKKYYKIKSKEIVKPKDVFAFVEEHGPVLIGIDLETGELVRDRLDKRGVITKRLHGFHSAVAMETSGNAGQYLLVADSNMGNSKTHYWWIQKVLSKMILQAYHITI